MPATPEPQPGPGRQGRGPHSLHRGARVVLREPGSPGGQRPKGQEKDFQDNHDGGHHDDDDDGEGRLQLQDQAGVGEQIQGCESVLIDYVQIIFTIAW